MPAYEKRPSVRFFIAEANDSAPTEYVIGKPHEGA